MKIDRETCPVGTRLIQKIDIRLWEYSVSEWSPGGLVCVRAARDNTVPEWYTAEELGKRFVEILLADPAVPTSTPPGPWLDVWPGEIPDGSVWEYQSKEFPDGIERFVAMDGKLLQPEMEGWVDGNTFAPDHGDRIRRVG